MSAFIANAPAPAAETAIEQDGWWPAVDPAVARDVLRLDGTVTTDRLNEALAAGIDSANQELAAWRAENEQAGYAKMEDVPCSHLSGESIHVWRYRRAVHALALANLVERYQSYDISPAAQKAAEPQGNACDQLRRDAHWALCDIAGRPHTTVELI